MDPAQPKPDFERAATHHALRRALGGAGAVYLALKWGAARLDGAAGERALVRWLAVCADHPVRCAVAAGLLVLAFTSFVRAAGAARPGRSEGSDL